MRSDAKRTALAPIDAVMDKVKSAVMLGTDRSSRAARSHHVLPQGRHDLSSGCVRRVSPDKLPFGAFMNKGLTMKSWPDAHAALHEAAA